MDEKKADDANLADLVAKSLKNVGETVFTTPSSSSKPKLAVATFLREIGPLKQPLALTSVGDGGILVLDRPDANRFRIMRFEVKDEASDVLFEIARGPGDAELMAPVSLTVDADGELYVVDSREGCIKKFADDGRCLDAFRSAGPTGKLFSNPLDVAIDEAGNLVAADTNNNRIVQLTPDGELGGILDRFPAAEGEETDEFYEPCSLCLGRGGVLRVADRNENRVLGFDAKRKLIGLWSDLLFPSQVRMAIDGTSVFVAERNRINLHAASGAVAATIDFPFDLGDGVAASGGGAIAADADGNLLVLDPVRESVIVLRM